MMATMTKAGWGTGEGEDVVEEGVAVVSTMAIAGMPIIQLALLHRITVLLLIILQSHPLVLVCQMAQEDLPWGEESHSILPMLFNGSGHAGGSLLPCSLLQIWYLPQVPNRWTPITVDTIVRYNMCWFVLVQDSAEKSFTWYMHVYWYSSGAGNVNMSFDIWMLVNLAKYVDIDEKWGVWSMIICSGIILLHKSKIPNSCLKAFNLEGMQFQSWNHIYTRCANSLVRYMKKKGVQTRENARKMSHKIIGFTKLYQMTSSLRLISMLWPLLFLPVCSSHSLDQCGIACTTTVIADSHSLHLIR